MRIGFDVTPLCVPQSGVGAYTRGLLEHLEAERRDEIVPLAHRPVPNGSSQPPSGPFAFNKTLWMQLFLPWQLARLRMDVSHFTNGVAPFWLPCPSVVTIHDMTLWLLPRCHPTRRLISMRPLVPFAARRAAAIIAVSNNTKRDIVRILDVPEHKVHVVYAAAAPWFRPLTDGQVADALQPYPWLSERFVLSVGTIEPRKNLVRLLEAFAQLRRDGGHGTSLVLVGHRGWKHGAVFSTLERLDLGESVRFLGHVPTEALVALYNRAEALVFPSLYEGFGLPIVEAMACGTPVVSSPNGSLREIAGDAAEFVDPGDVESIAAGLRRVLTDPTRRAELCNKGLARAAGFSWAASAGRTREVYRRAAQRRPDYERSTEALGPR